MDGTAIKEIHDNAAASFGAVKVAGAKHDVVALPENYVLHSLEEYNEHRDRFRGKFVTNTVASFAAYFDRAETPIFVDPDNVTANCIFDLGNEESPEHCQHTAKLKLDCTAAYTAFLQATGRDMGQRKTAEFFEDWAENVTGLNKAGEVIGVESLIATVRQMDVEAAKKSSSVVADHSESRSDFEKIEAKSDVGEMPAIVVFKCKPYEDLEAREFRCRLRVRPNGPDFNLARVSPETDDEEIAKEFATVLTEALETADASPTIYLGTFSS